MGASDAPGRRPSAHRLKPIVSAHRHPRRCRWRPGSRPVGVPSGVAARRRVDRFSQRARGPGDPPGREMPRRNVDETRRSRARAKRFGERLGGRERAALRDAADRGDACGPRAARAAGHDATGFAQKAIELDEIIARAERGRPRARWRAACPRRRRARRLDRAQIRRVSLSVASLAGAARAPRRCWSARRTRRDPSPRAPKRRRRRMRPALKRGTRHRRAAWFSTSTKPIAFATVDLGPPDPGHLSGRRLPPSSGLQGALYRRMAR